MEQQLLNILFGAALAVAGWFARELWLAVQELKTLSQKHFYSMKINLLLEQKMTHEYPLIIQKML